MTIPEVRDDGAGSSCWQAKRDKKQKAKSRGGNGDISSLLKAWEKGIVHSITDIRGRSCCAHQVAFSSLLFEKLRQAEPTYSYLPCSTEARLAQKRCNGWSSQAANRGGRPDQGRQPIAPGGRRLRR